MALMDTAKQPTNLLVTFLEYCSVISQDIKGSLCEIWSVSLALVVILSVRLPKWLDVLLGMGTGLSRSTHYVSKLLRFLAAVWLTMTFSFSTTPTGLCENVKYRMPYLIEDRRQRFFFLSGAIALMLLVGWQEGHPTCKN